MKKNVARSARTSGRARLVSAVLVGMMVLIGLSACDAEQSSDTPMTQGSPRYGGTLVIAAPTDLDYANTFVSGEGYTQELLRFALFMPLVKLGPDGELEPWLASRWEQLGDTAVVFHLRDDVRWHDGSQTTAYDVAFTYDRAREPETAYPNAKGYFGRWHDAEVVDSFTIRFDFEPHPDPLGGLPYFPIMPRHLLEDVTPSELRQAEFNHRPVGNGPFRFASRRSNDRWVFEANEDFPEPLGGRPYIDRIVWRVIPESTAQIAELLAGRVDLVLSPPARRLEEFDDRPGVRVLRRASRKYQFIAWNGQRAPLDDARVRRALMMAIDRRTILDVLRAGYGRLAVGPVVPDHWAFANEIETLPHDPDSALELLGEAGFQYDERDQVLRDADGRELRFSLTVPAGNEYSRSVAEMIQHHIDRIGGRVTLRTVDAATMFDELTAADRPFDAAFLAWESDLRLDLEDMFHSDAARGPYQFASYTNPEADRLLEEVAVAQDRKTARPLWHRLQQILRDDQPWGFLFYVPDLYLAQDRVRGLEMDVRGAFVNMNLWWLAEP